MPAVAATWFLHFLCIALSLLRGGCALQSAIQDATDPRTACGAGCVEAFRRCGANMTYSFCRSQMRDFQGEFAENVCPNVRCTDDPSMKRMAVRQQDAAKVKDWPSVRPTIPTLCTPESQGRCDCAQSPTPDKKGRVVRTFTWWRAGQQRCFTEYVPAWRDEKKRARPVVLSLQCHANDRIDAVGFKPNSDLIQGADRFDFIAIGLSSPNPESWDFGNNGVVNDSIPMPCSETHSDDATYVETVLKHLRRNQKIHDSSQFFVKGFSQNAMFAAYIAYCFPSQVAGVWQVSSGLAIKGHNPVPPRKETRCSNTAFQTHGEECEVKEPCKECKYFPIYPCHNLRPMVHCLSFYANDDETAAHPKDTNSRETLADTMYEVASKEGHDVRLMRFPAQKGNDGGHKPPENSFDWLAGCFGLSETCSDECAQALPRCMLKHSSQRSTLAYNSCMSQDLVMSGKCAKGCAPTQEMLFLSERPELRLSMGVFGQPIGGFHGVRDRLQPRNSVCSRRNRTHVEIRQPAHVLDLHRSLECRDPGCMDEQNHSSAPRERQEDDSRQQSRHDMADDSRTQLNQRRESSRRPQSTHRKLDSHKWWRQHVGKHGDYSSKSTSAKGASTRSEGSRSRKND